MATIRSTPPPRRPRWPASVTRTSYQVGKPWMFDGKMLREAIGTPIRRMERAKRRLALAEPEPLTLANFTTKSLVLFKRTIDMIHCYMRVQYRVGTFAYPKRQSGSA